MRILKELKANPEVKNYFTVKACVEYPNVCALSPRGGWSAPRCQHQQSQSIGARWLVVQRPPPTPFPPPAQSVVTFSMSVSLHGGSPDVSVVEVRRGRGPARVWHEWKYCFYAVAMLLLPPIAACPPPLGHANTVGPTIVFHEVYRTLLQKLSGMLATIN